jgi:LPS export ABC transporter protein LptC
MVLMENIRTITNEGNYVSCAANGSVIIEEIPRTPVKSNKYATPMENRYRLWRWVFFGAILGFTPEQDSVHGFPTLESSRFELLCSEQGTVKYKLFADKALHYKNGDRIYPSETCIEFYASNQEVSLTGRANSVYFSAEKNVYEFRGDVELRSLRDKRQLNTEELYWNTETKTLYTDKFIRIEAEDGLLTGEGLVARQDLSHYAIGKPQGLVNARSIK